jgi:translocation and assembly module TamB
MPLNPETDAAPVPSSKPLRQQRRRRLSLLLGLFALPTVVCAAALALWWSLATPAGSRWLLSHVPGLQVEAPQGSLLGDFSARRLRYALPGSPGGTLPADSIELDHLQWQGLQIGWSRSARLWAEVKLSNLQAERVQVLLTPATEPSRAPSNLLIPIGLQISRISIKTLEIPSATPKPVTSLRAAISLSTEQGLAHQIKIENLAWDLLRLNGSASIKSGGDLQLSANLQLQSLPTAEGNGNGNDDSNANSSASDLPAWGAAVQVSGPLQKLRLTATLQAKAQQLVAQAQVQPFAAWAVPQLQISTQQLDLSALLSSAPRTALTGQAELSVKAEAQPGLPANAVTLAVKAAFNNDSAGRWDQQRLPVRALTLALDFSPADLAALDIQSLDLLLGSAAAPAGRARTLGKSSSQAGSQLSIALENLRSEGLDARLSPLQVSGNVVLNTSRSADPLAEGEPPPLQLQISTQLSGRLTQPVMAGTRALGANLPLSLQAQATLSRSGVNLQSFNLKAAEATLEASGELTLTRNGNLMQGWQASAQASAQVKDLRQFWRGLGSEGSKSASSARQSQPQPQPQPLPLAAVLEAKLAGGPFSSGAAATLLSQAPTGSARLQLKPATLGGVPVSADVTYARTEGGVPQLQAELLAGSNKIRAEARIENSENSSGNPGRSGVSGSVRSLGAAEKNTPQLVAEVDLRAGQLTSLQGLLASFAPQLQLLGSLEGKVSLQARQHAAAQAPADAWVWHSEAALEARDFLLGGVSDAQPIKLGAGQLSWDVSSTLDAPLLAKLQMEQLGSNGFALPTGTLTLNGSWAKHMLQLDTVLEGRVPAALVPPGQPLNALTRGPLKLSLQGGLKATPEQTWRAGGQWLASQVDLSARSQEPPRGSWLQAQGLSLKLDWAAGGLLRQATMQPGRLELFGAGLRWQQLAWSRAAGVSVSPQAGIFSDQATLDLQLEPLSVAPLLARWQPDFGWGGTLVVAGHARISTQPVLSVDLLLERRSGDLTVTDDNGTQQLGLTDLRVGLLGSPGLWHLTQALAGSNVGVLGGALTARNNDGALLPNPSSQLEGVLEARVANLGTWGAWVPAGWRAGGALFASASFSGQLRAPEINGRAGGNNLTLRNPLLGIDVQGGEFALTLAGGKAELESFKARAGDGDIKASGSLLLGAAPRADLRITADKFGLLRRADRRLALNGKMQLRLDAAALDLQGRLDVEEGLFDFSRGNAPELASDVVVLRPSKGPALVAAKAATPRVITVKLDINLGKNLRVLGHGVNTLLGGELQLTQAASGPVLHGTINTERGTFDAYGQKLTIERGQITFAGVLDNPRLDVLAIRTGESDVRVGVAITGTALAPRIKLYSDPDLPDTSKLSWLLLGRAPDTLQGADTALLQSAALALLSGSGESRTGKLFKSVGLDEVSVTDSGVDAKGTVVRLGRQVSQRWYVGYERGLNATTGSWQLIYRIAQRFTLRAQSGDQNALDLIWQWKWE